MYYQARGMRRGGGQYGRRDDYQPQRGAQRIEDDDFFRPQGFSGFKPAVLNKNPNKAKLTKRDKQRADDYRVRKNEQTGYDMIAADIDKTLHPGFASLANAVKDLSITTKAAKIVPVSTIAIGPLIQEGVNTIRRTVRNLPQDFNRFAFYRVALGMLDTRLYTQYKMRGRTARQGAHQYQETWLDSNRRDVLLGHKHHLLSFLNYLNTVGNFIHNEVQYYVGVPQAHTPCTVTIQNLRDCINLATNGPIAVRRLFFRNNPFPFAEYAGPDDDPVLVNGDDICPADYGDDDFHADLTIVKDTCAATQRKYPKKIGDSVDYSSPGHRALLVSSISDPHDRFRAIPERDVGPQLNNIAGTIDDFWTSENNLTDQDFYYASLTLAGHYIDMPNVHASFGVRDEVWACMSSNTNAVSNMKVHY